MRLRTLPILLLAASALVPACAPNRAHTPPLVEPDTPIASDSAVQVADAVAPIQLEFVGEVANRYVRADQPGEVLARIRVRSPESTDAQRPRANIGLVVDTSASMEGEAIAQAREAALTLLDGLRDGDVLSVVALGSTADVLVAATELDQESRPKIREAIETMKATGTTELFGGLQASLQQVQSMARSGEINRIVLVSDGVPNDASQVQGLAQQARNGGVPITTLGLGLEYHETLLGQIAQTSGGKFHFVEEPDAVAAVFRDEVLSIDRLAARGVALTLTPGPGVSIVEAPGMSLGWSGRHAVIGLPDMAEGETFQVIVKLAVGEHRDGATVELLDGLLTYTDARLGSSQQERTFVAAKSTADEQTLSEGVDLDVSVAAARATTAAVVLQVVAMARAGQVEAATAKLDQTVKTARALSEKMPDTQLAKLIDDLVELRPTLPELAPPPPPKGFRTKGKALSTGPQPVPHGRALPSSRGVGSGARGIRASHERAYKVLNGG